MVEQTITPVKKTNGTLRRWEPFDMFETLQQELERFWHRPFSLATGPLPALFQRPTTVGTSYAPRPENREAYDILYGEYVRLHDLFGRGGDEVMRRLKRLQIEANAVAAAS